MAPQVIDTTSYIDASYLRMLDGNDYLRFPPADVTEALKSAFGEVNSVLVQKVNIPLKLDRNGDYDERVKKWQALITLSNLYMKSAPDVSDYYISRVRNDAGTGLEDKFLDEKWLLDEQISSTEIGIQQAVPDSGNRGTGHCYAYTRGDYNGDRRVRYTIEITTAGASGTAVFKYKCNMDTSYTTSKTTSTDLTSIGNWGVQIYFPDADTSEAYNVGDIWTIDCIPEFEKPSGPSVRSVPLQRA